MSSSSTTSSTNAVNAIMRSTAMLSQIWPICLFAVGALGHALSIYVLTRPAFRSNPSARYFLAMTLTGCLVVYVTLPIRLLQSVYKIDVLNYSDQSCQILSYLLNCIRVLPSWFVVLAAIDRYLCSSFSVSLRRWSNIRVTAPAIVLTTLLVLLLYIHMPFNYTILLPQRTCDFSNNTYRGFFAVWNLVCWSCIPSIAMLVFGFLTILHIRQAKRRVVPQNPENLAQRNQSKVDRQLIHMLVLQCFVLASTSTVGSVASLYITVSNSLRTKTPLEKLQDNMLMVASNSVSLIGPCTSFYLFTLTSPLFRRVLFDLFRRSTPVQRITTIRTATVLQMRN